MNCLRLIPLIAAFTLGLPAFGADGSAAVDSLEAIQKTAAEWTRLRSESIRLQSEWERERALLESTTIALRERVAALTQRRDGAEAQVAEVRAELDALKVRQADLVKSIGAMEARVAALVAGLEQTRPFLPPRLSAALALPYRSLADGALPTAERVQYAVTILSRCLQFNKGITYSEEVLDGSKGADARVAEVVYWGLAAAYAVDRVGGRAYVGQPGANGWEWSPRDDAFAQIAHLIAVTKDATEPEFVEVPARLVSLPGVEEKP